MTVCIAAICDRWTILGASDRMLTAGDIQFEPQQSKIQNITSSIAIVIAGDYSIQTEILQNVDLDVRKSIDDNPAEWLNVKAVACIYYKYLNMARSKRAENAILAPIGMDGEMFIARQREMSSKLVVKLATELINYSMPQVQAIVAGVDTTGAHIYIVSDEGITCQDGVGFAAIGVGSWHANSQFMFSGHTRYCPLPESLLLTFTAKKRAEVAPGVGEATDMFMVGPKLGSYIAIGDHVISKLNDIYNDVQKRIQEVDHQAKERVNQYVQEITSTTVIKEQSAKSQDGERNESIDNEDLRITAEEYESKN